MRAPGWSISHITLIACIFIVFQTNNGTRVLLAVHYSDGTRSAVAESQISEARQIGRLLRTLLSAHPVAVAHRRWRIDM